MRSVLAAGVFGALSLAPVRAQDQDDAKQAPPVAAAKQDTPMPLLPGGSNFRVRPNVKVDGQRPRRTVQINGVISEGEWDPFYTIADGPIKGTVYCNWDENYLYLAARTDAPATLVFDVDANNDGWLRGADNMEVVIGSVNEGGGTPTVAARLLDASNSKEAPAWNDKVIDPKSIQVAGKIDNGAQVVEIAIPRNAGSLVLRPGAILGLRGEFLPAGDAAGYMPTAAFEPHLLLDATLVEARIIGINGLSPRLTISDNKCVAGQRLFATLELLNQTDIPVPIKAVLWTGQGNSTNAVNTFREVSVPPVGPMKRRKFNYKTLLPADLAPGAYTLNVVAEIDTGKQVQSSASFSVVEPLQAQMVVTPDPVTIVGPTRLEIGVDVYNATPGQMNCDVELLTSPPGWDLETKRTKLPLTIDKEDAHNARSFTFRLPSTTPAGDYPIDATVTWHKRVWKVRTIVHVLRPDPTQPPPGVTQPVAPKPNP